MQCLFILLHSCARISLVFMSFTFDTAFIEAFNFGNWKSTEYVEWKVPI